jgi:flagellar motor switch protein FliM
MENILTKEEIDALLSAVFEGKIDPEKELAKASGGVSNQGVYPEPRHNLRQLYPL